ncbi:mitochondrial intermediate peptidase-like [Amphibalanus amphitrite]|uniref:mitochondrial intermediate peptidase-like n=1 Tax=Amphibalanus amphitrite TaxID=1232801 RepID=UPI001C91D486|nr:mitochondrial intermediate peptidase-like [Amphibalanus amphitrite]XP_043242924.1 mitochondrial intermediate peptidase-like [Amphibalanus amphitrite]
MKIQQLSRLILPGKHSLRWSHVQLRIHGLCQKRGLSTSSLGKLGAAFDTKQQPRVDLGWWKENEGLFGYPELRTADGFLAMRDGAVCDCRRLVDEACSPRRRRKMVLVFDDLSDALCKVADMAEFVRLAHPDASYQATATEACIAVSNLVEQMNTHRPLYDALERAVAHGDHVHTDGVDQHVARLYLHDFEQSGIHLDGASRERVVQLTDHALQVGQAFLAGTHEPATVKKKDLPEDLSYQFAVDGDSVTVGGLMADSPLDQTREAAYRVYLHPDPGQEALLAALLHTRRALAHLCGFPSFAHRALRGSLARTPETVDAFLCRLRDELAPEAAKEFDTMASMKRATSSRPLGAWDVPYLAHLARRQRQREEDLRLSEYFSVGTCMRGLSALFGRLYGVRLEAEEARPGELWAPDVQKLAVVHESEGLLGYIYCDFYTRPGKPSQDCHFTIRGGRDLPDGTYQSPVVVLMLGLQPPGWSRPCLLTHAQLENLFHETGHAMHSMLARTRYQHVTGTRCSTDFAEVPSVLMEYFAGDERVLASFARHYRTGEPPPPEALRRLCRGRAAFPAADAQLQLFYAALDQRYHGTEPLLAPTTDVLAEVQHAFYGLPHVAGTAWQLRFGHLVGYGGRYYSYLMARAVASAIWRELFRADPFDRSAGERYRRECLAHGGGVPAHQIVSGLLRRDVSPAELASSIVTDVIGQRAAG